MTEIFPRYTMGEFKHTSDVIRHSIVHKVDYEVLFHCHSYHELFLIFEGGIYHEVNGEVQKISNNSLVFIRQDDVHRYRPLGEEDCGMLRLWISPQISEKLELFLGGSSVISSLLSSKLPPVVSLNKLEVQNLVERFEDVFSLPAEDNNGRSARLKLLFVELVLHFNGYGDENKSKNVPDWLLELCRQMAVKENFITGIDKLFELSPSTREHSSRSFKKYLNTTPTEYISRLRLNYAANQLASTNKAIIDVCFDSGFGNLSYFYKSFEQVYGKTPKSYRIDNVKQTNPS